MTVSLQKIFQGHLYGRSNNFDRTHERFSRRSDTNNSKYKLPVPPPRQTKIQLCTLREISSKLYHVEIKKSPLFPSFFNLWQNILPVSPFAAVPKAYATHGFSHSGSAIQFLKPRLCPVGLNVNHK